MSKSWPYLILLVCLVGFFWDTLFSDKALIMRDVWQEWLPTLALERRMVWSGHFPLWNPFSGCGQPLLGNPLHRVLYPLNIPFILFPVITGLKIYLLVHLFIAGAGMYCLLRSWECGKAAALIGALSDVLGTYTIAHLEWLGWTAALAWLPWTILFADKLYYRAAAEMESRRLFIRLSSFGKVAKLTILLVLLYLSGNPEVWYQCMIILFLYVLIEFPARHGWRKAVWAWQGISLSIFLAAIITSPQWLLLLQRVQLSVRQASIDPRLSQASLHPLDWLTLLLPYLFGRPGYPDKYWAITIFEFWVGTIYIGILPLILALGALIAGWRVNLCKRAHMVFLTALLALGLLLASGKYTPVFMLFHHYVPGFSKLRWPGKMLIFVHFALCLLAGLGMQLLLNWRDKLPQVQKQRFGWAVFAAIVFLAVVLGLTALANPIAILRFLTLNKGGTLPSQGVDFHQQLLAALLICLGGLVATLLLAYRPIPGRIGVAVFVAVCYADLVCIARQVQPIGPEEFYEFPLSVLPEAIGKPSSLIRVESNYASMGQYLYGSSNPQDWDLYKPLAVANSWLNYNIGLVWGSGLVLDKYQQVLQIPKMVNAKEANRLADLMSVDYLIGWRNRPEPWYGEFAMDAKVFARPKALPRAHLVAKWVICPNWQLGPRIALANNFNPWNESLLQADDPTRKLPRPNPRNAARQMIVQSIHYNWEQCNVDVETDGKALLVVSDIFYPGWKCTVNGKPAPIYRANMLFRGVIVHKGISHVEFRYRPWQLIVGAIASVTTVILMLASGFLLRTRKRHTKRMPMQQPDGGPDSAQIIY